MIWGLGFGGTRVPVATAAAAVKDDGDDDGTVLTITVMLAIVNNNLSGLPPLHLATLTLHTPSWMPRSNL